MTEEQLNKRIHEIMGLCGHENISQIWNECFDCHKHDAGLSLIDFVNSWEGFGILWGFMQGQEYNKKITFRDYIWSKKIGHGDWSGDLADADAILETIISPSAFAKAVVEFFEAGI